MAELVVEVSRREGTGKGIARKLRRDGRVPAIVYGGHREAVPITVDLKVISEIVTKSEHGVRSVFLLKMAGTDQQRHAMIKDIQIDPIKRSVTHIDFVRVVMDEVVRVTIPVHLSGTAVGVKVGGGVLDFQARDLHVECLPGAIPDTFDIDVTPLQIHHFVRVSDLPIPPGVRILDDPDRVIVSITLPRAEVSAEATAEAEEETAEPELIKKGKTEEES
ncbi:MAG TPA: 50S ribosomal protein L25 [Thermoanaerobaculia bacterium]|nr:50S ribosomal protein L25 [Thermoanaerobaculia bacterium]